MSLSAGEPLSPTAAGFGIRVSPEEERRLLAFEDLLRARAVPLGLVSENDAGRLRARHILDCLRAALAVGPRDALGYDLGSGAGLPGIVVAIARPRLHVTLIEARRRRVAFLELAVDELRLRNVSVLACRLEDVAQRADLCFMRGVAPIGHCWEVASRLLAAGGRVAYFAGPRFREADLPAEATSVLLVRTPVLESSGPLVIMGRR